jgi:hypothetical protein
MWERAVTGWVIAGEQLKSASEREGYKWKRIARVALCLCGQRAR